LYPLPFNGGPLYASTFWTAYLLWLAFETRGTFRHRSKNPANARDRGSYLLIIILLWIGVGLAFALSFVLPQATITWHSKAVFFNGIALMLLGMAFRYYAMIVLGKFFTYQVAVHSGQPVIETGPYRYIRHPSYTGALITLVGLGLALGNWASLVVLLACMGAAYAYRISVEESALISALGEPYKNYIRRTRRLVPFLF
jgi:protein-S-isoprenylcysteine O-methyltransferase Ste14